MATRFNSVDSWPSLGRSSSLGGLVGRRAVAGLRHGMGAVAFWSGIALPLSYLPLMAQGIESLSGLGLVLGLIALHLAALIGGRDYRRD